MHRRRVLLTGFILAVGLSVFKAPSTAEAAHLYIYSGFETGVSLELTPNAGRIAGKDQTTGWSWNDDLPRVPAFTVLNLGDLGRIPDDRNFELSSGEDGHGRALLMQVINNNQSTAPTRADCTLRFSRDPAFEQLYVRFRMKLDPLYPEAITATGQWFQLTEYKSVVGPEGFRMTLAIRVEQEGTKIYPVAEWRLLEAGLKTKKRIEPRWTVRNPAVNVPFGSWFEVEMFLKLGKAGVGRFYYTIDGRVVFDIRDQDTVSIDPHLPLAHWSIFKLYQHPDIIRWMRDHGSSCQAWYDELEIWDDIPSENERQAQLRHQ